MSGAIVRRHFDVLIGCFVFGLGLFAFQSISLGLNRTFFIIGGWTVRSCGYGMFCYGLSLGLPLTAPFQQFRIVQAHFTNCVGQNNVMKMRSCSLYCKKKGIPYSLSY